MKIRKVAERIKDLSMQYYTESGLPIEDRMDLDQYVHRIFEILRLSGFRKVREDKLKKIK